jgi:hypothetical protein
MKIKKTGTARKKREIPPGFIAVRDAMSRLRLGRTTVVELMRSNRLSSVKLWGVWYIRESDVVDEIERRERSNKILRKDTTHIPTKAARKASTTSAAPTLPPMTIVDEGSIAAKAVPILRKGLGERDLVEMLAIPFELAERLAASYRKADRDRELVIDERRLPELRALIGWDDGPPTTSGFFGALRGWKQRAEEACWQVAQDVRDQGWHALTDPHMPGPPRVHIGATGISILLYSCDEDGIESCRSVDITSLVTPTPAEIEYAARRGRGKKNGDNG